MDALSDVLRVIRLQGALFLDAQFCAPWCVAAPSGTQLAQALEAAAPQLMIFHLVTDGSCSVQLGDEPPLELAAGDIVVFPHGDAHRIGSAVHHPPLAMAQVMSGLQRSSLAFARADGDGDPAHLICGWISSDASLHHPIYDALPRVLCVNIRRQSSGAWVEASIRQLVSEAAEASAGREAMTARLAEALFIETLRCYIAGLPAQQSGWLAGLRDPLTSRAISLLHERPAQDWTVDALARAVGSSRSVLNERFTRYLGQPPMQYLARWRLTLAADLLRDPRQKLGRIAETVGYETEAAFNRAFKREYGLPPGSWRRQKLG